MLKAEGRGEFCCIKIGSRQRWKLYSINLLLGLINFHYFHRMDWDIVIDFVITTVIIYAILV